MTAVFGGGGGGREGGGGLGGGGWGPGERGEGRREEAFGGVPRSSGCRLGVGSLTGLRFLALVFGRVAVLTGPANAQDSHRVH